MGKISDYLAWRGDLTFEKEPYNEVDSLIFALISYIDFSAIIPSDLSGEGIALKTVANAYMSRYPDYETKLLGVIVPREIISLFLSLRNVPRYQNVGIKGYREDFDVKREIQFSAVTFVLSTQAHVVAFRGTDDTVVGWKEDFNLCFLPVLPSQQKAKEYLNEVGKNSKGTLYITGHSKGGNLSFYAGVMCDPDVQERIAVCHSFDGPGFQEDFYRTKEYLCLQNRMTFFTPQGSVIGMMMFHKKEMTVVKSNQIGIGQHNGLSWDVMGNALVHLSELAPDGKRNEVSLRQWIFGLSPEERKSFVNALFDLFMVHKIKTLTELVSNPVDFVKNLQSMDPSYRKIVLRVVDELVRINGKNQINEIRNRINR